MNGDQQQVVAIDAVPDEPPAAGRLVVIEPRKGWTPPNLREVWQSRDLLGLLVWRDFSVRYRQSVVGVGWSIVRPLLSVVVFTVIFGYLAKLPSDGLPYPVFAFAAMMPWRYFSNCLTNSTNSLVAGAGLLQKVYFPRLVLPLSSVVVGLVDFLIELVVLALMMAWYGLSPNWGVLLLPLLLAQTMITALAFGLWLTALNVKYRDVAQLVPFVLQMWMYLTPIVYSRSLVPEQFQTLYNLNPMVGVVEGFRWAMLGQSAPDWTMMGVSFAAILVLFVGGLFFFRRTEDTLADVL